MLCMTLVEKISWRTVPGRVRGRRIGGKSTGECEPTKMVKFVRISHGQEVQVDVYFGTAYEAQRFQCV